MQDVTPPLPDSVTSSQTIDIYDHTTPADRHLTTVHGVLSNSIHADVDKTTSVLLPASLTTSGDHVTTSPDMTLSSSTGSVVESTPRSGRSANHTTDRVVIVVICISAVVLVVAIAIVTAILVRRRRTNKVRRYARPCYVQSQFFDVDSVDTLNDTVFFSRFQEFVFDMTESQDGEHSGLTGKQRPRSVLSAHEDALRAATSPPSRPASSNTPVDRSQRSTNNNNKILSEGSNSGVIMKTSGHLDYSKVQSTSSSVETTVSNVDCMKSSGSSEEDHESHGHDSALQVTISNGSDRCRRIDVVGEVFLDDNDCVLTSDV